MLSLHSKQRVRTLLSAFCGAALLAVAGSCLAQSAEPQGQALRLGGFGTLGFSRTSAPPHWGFQRDSSQPSNDGGIRFDTDTRLGLQANYTSDPRFELVGQLLLTRRFSAATPGDAVLSAFAAYRPTDSLSLRAGRIGTHLYMLSDYRSVGLAYPFVRPPVEFYGLLPSAFDGIDATQVWRDSTDAVWKLNGFYGRTRQGDNQTLAFRTVRPVYGLTFSREVQGLLIQASVAHSRFTANEPRLAPLVAALQAVSSLPVASVAADAQTLQRQLQLQNQRVDYFALSINHDQNDWLWMMEVSHANVQGVKRFDTGYALLGHRFERLTPYAALSAARARADESRPQWTAQLAPVIGAAGAAQTQALGDLAHDVATVGPKQRTLSLGMRFDATAQAALKLQVDRIRVSSQGSLLWANGTEQPASAHVVTATVDFIF